LVDFLREKWGVDLYSFGLFSFANTLRVGTFTNISNTIRVKAIEGVKNKPEYLNLRVAHGKDRCANPPWIEPQAEGCWGRSRRRTVSDHAPNLAVRIRSLLFPSPPMKERRPVQGSEEAMRAHARTAFLFCFVSLLLLCILSLKLRPLRFSPSFFQKCYLPFFTSSFSDTFPYPARFIVVVVVFLPFELRFYVFQQASTERGVFFFVRFGLVWIIQFESEYLFSPSFLPLISLLYALRSPPV